MTAAAVSAVRGATAGLSSSVPAALLCFASQNTATQHNTATAEKEPPRRAWKPDGDAHLIFQWVKMEGKSQGWVAMALGIHQSTVSRVVQRYERWQAHARQREDLRLDPAERLRSQRWLTFERNELILTTCLRLAGKLEDVVDSSRSTIRRPLSDPLAESEVRTEHFTLDRTGMAARFLRLAFKINLEQLKLAELEQPPLPEPLSAEELAEEERQVLADAQEFAAARTRSAEAARRSVTEADEVGGEGELAQEAESAEPTLADVASPTADPVLGTEYTVPTTDEGAAAFGQPHHAPAPEPLAPLHTLHNLHSEIPPQIAATLDQPCSCASPGDAEKNSAAPCIIAIEPPDWPGYVPDKCSPHRATSITTCGRA
jgi:hypothetical protein